MDKVEIGCEAQRALEDPAVSAAFRRVDSDLVELWRGTPASDQAQREGIWQMVTALAKVREKLAEAVREGAQEAAVRASEEQVQTE